MLSPLLLLPHLSVYFYRSSSTLSPFISLQRSLSYYSQHVSSFFVPSFPFAFSQTCFSSSFFFTLLISPSSVHSAAFEIWHFGPKLSGCIVSSSSFPPPTFLFSVSVNCVVHTWIFVLSIFIMWYFSFYITKWSLSFFSLLSVLFSLSSHWHTLLLVFLFWHVLPSLSLLSGHTHTHSGGEVERLVLACHLSSALTLALITASPLANAASLGLRSMCSRHKRRREFALGNASLSHYGIRKSVWCERQFTPAAKRSFCFSLSLSL